MTQGRIPGTPGTGFRGQTEETEDSEDTEDTAAEASSGQITFSDLKDYYVCMKSVKNRRTGYEIGRRIKR